MPDKNILHIGVREAKNHFSRYAARAAAGEIIIITKAGKPIARLEPLGGTEMLRSQRVNMPNSV